MNKQTSKTDSQKLDDISREIRNIKIIHGVGVAIVILGFIGIATLTELISKLKK